MARHRHVANVRSDGIAVVLGPLLDDVRIIAAALVDVDSGMVLDAWSAADPAAEAPDLELIGAQHAEIVRCGLALLRTWPPKDPREPTGPRDDDTCEVVLGADGGCRHLLRTVPDPHGDRLALAVVVDGPPRVLDRVRKRLRSVAVDALTAGPSMTRRPVRGAWSFALPGPDVPASTDDPTGPLRLPLPVPRADQRDGLRPAGVHPAGVHHVSPRRPPSPPAALPAPVPPPRGQA